MSLYVQIHTHKFVDFNPPNPGELMQAQVQEDVGRRKQDGRLAGGDDPATFSPWCLVERERVVGTIVGIVPGTNVGIHSIIPYYGLYGDYCRDPFTTRSYSLTS